MTKQAAMQMLEQANLMISGLRSVIAALPEDDIGRRVRKIRKTRTVDYRLFKPIDELKETVHIQNFIKEFEDAGITRFTSGELLIKLVPDVSQHSTAKKAFLRYVLTGLGYEYVSQRIPYEDKIVKRWRKRETRPQPI